MALHCIFHTPYRFTATLLISLMAFIGLATWEQLDDKTTNCAPSSTEHMQTYLIARTILGIIQFIVHGFILIPAQYIRAMGNWTLASLMSKDKFYANINICNLALVLFAIANLYGLIVSVGCYPQVKLLWICETISLSGTLYVLGLRSLAIILGRVRDWFYLDWD